MGCSANVLSWVADSTWTRCEDTMQIMPSEWAPLQIAWQHGVEACWQSNNSGMVSHTDIIISWRGNFSWFGKAASGKSTWLQSFGALHGVLRLQLSLFCWSSSIGNQFQRFSGSFRGLHLVQGKKKQLNMFDPQNSVRRIRMTRPV